MLLQNHLVLPKGTGLLSGPSSMYSRKLWEDGGGTWEALDLGGSWRRRYAQGKERNEIWEYIGSIDSAGLAVELRWCLSGDIQLLPLALAAKLHVMPSFPPPRLQPSHHISLTSGYQTTCPFTSIL